ncbi:MAG: DUF4442 domain-containing protein [Flavicella sp.]
MYKSAVTFLSKFIKVSTIYKYGFNWSPMYRRSTAKLVVISDNMHLIKIRLQLNWKNRNYAGSIFGGSMLSATDPIYMIQLVQILGSDYVVWDKAVTARYKKPARGTVYGDFVFTKEEIVKIQKRVSEENEIDITKAVSLVDQEGDTVATFDKTVYIAKKAYYKEKLKRRKAMKK